MTIFLIGAVAMMVLALSFVLPVLLKKDPGGSPDEHIRRDVLNLAVLRDQLRELDADLQAGSIDATSHQNALQELEWRVAQDVVADGMAPKLIAQTNSRQGWSALVVALSIPVIAGSLYILLGTPKALTPPPLVAVNQDEPQVTMAQIEAMVNKLAERLKSNPNDAEGWKMLTRSYETTRRFDLAVDAYKHLIALKPDDAEVLTDYAVTLAMSLNQNLSGEPERLINRALEIDPNNVQALALSGSVFFERKDYAKAASTWKNILALVPSESDVARSIETGIAKAESLAEAEKETR